LISDIHEIIGKGLISNAGKYRTLCSKPAQEDWEYLNPKLIEKSLEKLCKFVVEQLEKKGDLLFVTKLAAIFMTHFLHIHPFSNGNGRVARIAVSLILSCQTVVPIALFCSVNSRNTYLDCLRESRSYPVTFVPSALARLILESIWTTNWNIVYSLELSS
jgi:Fic family protein